MNGAQSLLETLADGGLEVCFAIPGTSEMHLVSAIDQSDRVRSILALFEGVATGAADGYGRMTGRPAATLLHLGPGLANGLANLRNARRARSPILNIVGDHATQHLAFDAPLTSDLVGVARPMSAWVEASRSASDLATLGAEALRAAQQPAGIAARPAYSTLSRVSGVTPDSAMRSDLAMTRPVATRRCITKPCAALIASLLVYRVLLGLRVTHRCTSNNAINREYVEMAPTTTAATFDGLF